MGNRDRREKRGALRLVRHTTLSTEVLRILVRDDLLDPDLEQLELSTVELSPDGHHLRAWFLSPDPDRAALALARAAPYLRVRFAEQLGSKRVPELHFYADPRVGGGAL